MSIPMGRLKMLKFLKGFACAAALLTLIAPARAGDVDAGENVFKKCKACHAVGEGAKNKVGPELNDLFGRAAGGLDGFKYSKAMVEQGQGGLVWDADTLAGFLAEPRGSVKGTKMAFAGLKKSDDVDNVLAYLATFSKAAEPAATEPAPAADAPEKAEAPTDAAPIMVVSKEGLKLGRHATKDEVAAWDIDIRPDGLGLPVGKGTVAEGEPIYTDNCASCHGDFGEAIDRWPVLAGGQGTLTNERPVKTIGSYWPYLSTVYDYVRRAMPFGNARSLSDDDVYALTAYILYLNDIVTDEDFELSDQSFKTVTMPNLANFVPDDRENEPYYASKTEPCMTDCKPGPVKITMRAMVLDVTPESGDDADGAGAIE
jgi:cytochrome c